MSHQSTLKYDDANSQRMELDAVYDELRRLASKAMARLPCGCTLQPTALVHEAWLRLGGADQAAWHSRAHYLAAAAEAMNHFLIDRARKRCAARHGGHLQRVDIDQLEIPIDTEEDDDILIAISAALEKLSEENGEAAALAWLRVFAGLEVAEAATLLDIPRTTAYRRWQFAVTWLYCDLNPDAIRTE